MSLVLLADIVRFFFQIIGKGAGNFTWYLSRPLFTLLELKMFTGFIFYLAETFIVALFVGYVLFHSAPCASCCQSGAGKEQVAEKAEPAQKAAALQDDAAQPKPDNSAATQLKDKLAADLSAFSAEGLTVAQTGGNVTVTLSEGLWPTGTYAASGQCATAIKRLAESLKGSDTSIAVEGHTDNVSQHGSVIADNWDLSAKRATSVLRILVDEGISADRVSATGRADTRPVADNSTPEGRSKNRRVEIVLTPGE